MDGQFTFEFLTPAEAFERDHSALVADVRARPVRYADHPKVSLRRLKFLADVKQEVIDDPQAEHPTFVPVHSYRTETAFRARYGEGRVRQLRPTRDYRFVSRRLQGPGEGVRGAAS